MNEAKWRTGADPTPMLKGARCPQSGRKLRLYSCACCERLAPHLPPASRNGVTVAERYADGRSSRAELEGAHAQASAALLALPALPRDWTYEVLRLKYATKAAAGCCSHSAATIIGAAAIGSTAADAVALTIAVAVPEEEFTPTRIAARTTELVAQARLVREIFGNRFDPVVFAPDWRTDTAVCLARQMYESREFSAMPILADALQDAGCDDEELLNHCRDKRAGGAALAGGLPFESHVRGCWVVDLVLEKE